MAIVVERSTLTTTIFLMLLFLLTAILLGVLIKVLIQIRGGVDSIGSIFHH